jgi:hypothetical protein
MTVWLVGAIVTAAGGVGGLIAAVLSDDRAFARPTRVTAAAGAAALADPATPSLPAPLQALDTAKRIPVQQN